MKEQLLNKVENTLVNGEITHNEFNSYFKMCGLCGVTCKGVHKNQFLFFQI